MLSEWQEKHAFVTSRQDEVRGRDGQKRIKESQRLEVGVEM